MAEQQDQRRARRLTPQGGQGAAKAAKQAEKARKKASNDPADMGRMRQIRRAYQVTHEYDKALPYLLLAAFLLPLAAAIVIGLLTDQLLNLDLRRPGPRDPAADDRAGPPGQEGDLQAVRRARPGRPRWRCRCCPRSGSPPRSSRPTGSQDVVHRTLGPGGLVLIGEGEPGRVKAAAGQRGQEARTGRVRDHGDHRGDGQQAGPGPAGQARRPHPEAAQDPAAQPGDRPQAAAAGAGRRPAAPSRCPRARCPPTRDRSRAPGRRCAAADRSRRPCVSRRPGSRDPDVLAAVRRAWSVELGARRAPAVSAFGAQPAAAASADGRRPTLRHPGPAGRRGSTADSLESAYAGRRTSPRPGWSSSSAIPGDGAPAPLAVAFARRQPIELVRPGGPSIGTAVGSGLVGRQPSRPSTAGLAWPPRQRRRCLGAAARR